MSGMIGIGRGLVVLGLVLLLLIAGARAALAASPACGDERRVAVEIVSELGDPADDVAMLEYLEGRLPERLALEGLCLDPGARRRVVATVAWSDAAHGDYAIALRATLSDPERTAEPFEPSAVDCPECATIEVLDTIATQVPVALAGLEPAAPDPTMPVPRAPVPPAPTPSLRPPAPDRARLHRLGHAGIGLATAGVAGIVTGAVLWAQHSVVHPADSDYRLVLRPAGITLVVAGVLATAAGGTMIGVDLHRVGHRAGHRLALRPAMGSRRAGLIVSGSF